jgi:ATP-dependent Lon protease
MSESKQAERPDLPVGELSLPAELPILPISEAVIFPYMMVPLVLSDENLIQLADDCLAHDKILGAFAQKEIEEEEEGEDEGEGEGEEDQEQPESELIYHVGTAVKIQKMLRFPDGSMRLLGQGISRCRITGVVSEKPYLRAHIEAIHEPEQHDSQTLAYMRGVANNFLKIIDASENISDELKVVVMNIDDPGRLADLIATNLDIDVAEKQQILEEAIPRKRLQILARIVIRELDVVESARPSTRISGSTTCGSSSRPSSASWGTRTRVPWSWTS